MALAALDDYDYTKVWAASWSYPDLGDPAGSVKFSPDSRMVIFGLNVTATFYSIMSCFVLEAYDVASGKQLWSTHNPKEATGQAIFSPDGSMLLIPELGGDLLAYHAEDGALVQRLPTGLNEPIQALAFDHDGKTLWLATDEGLRQYQPKE
jgi:WD40 repeat protein